MMRQRQLGAAIGQRLHRVRRIHVLILHEPARLIGADRQYRQPQRPVLFGDAAKMLAFAVAGIADDVEFAGRRLQHETRPQRLVAVGQSARRPVSRRHQRHRHAVAEFDAILPVERLGFDGGVRVAHGDIVAERRDHARREFRREFRQRREIEMVVMAMRDQHDVDLRQRVERNAGVVVPLGPGEGDGRGPHRPHRIDENVEIRRLDQPGDMADERQPDLVAADARRRRIAVRVRHPIRPAGALPVGAELPAQHLGQ